MARKILAGLVACALLRAASAEADISYSAYLLDEDAARVEAVSLRLFALPVSRRQPLEVSALSDDFEPMLYLVSPDKRVWAQEEIAVGRATISVADAAPGEWYVAVRSLDPRSRGAFALLVEPAGDPRPVAPALPPDAEVALAALRLWSGIEEPGGRDPYAGHARGLAIPDTAAPADAAAPATPPEEDAPEPLAPLLPWPPPEPSARMLMPRELLADPATLGELDDRLRAALRRAGYDDVGYFAVPDGFAAVTRLEQFRETGEPVADGSRWEMGVPGARSFDILDYLEALLTAQTGHFRVIVFVVTSTPFTASDAEVEAASAQRWAQSGRNALIPSLRAQPFTADVAVTALVYEFSKIRGERSVRYELPGGLTATMHLQAAGILAALRN